MKKNSKTSILTAVCTERGKISRRLFGEKSKDAIISSLLQMCDKQETAEENHPYNYEWDLLHHRWNYVEALLEGRVVPPYEVEVQPSSICNISCSWCIGVVSRGDRKFGALPHRITETNAATLAKKLTAYQMGKFKVDVVKISGYMGEPLINARAVIQLVNVLSSNGVKVGLFTNGLLLNQLASSAILPRLEYIHISLDADTPTTYYRLKGTNSFEKVLQNIESIVRERKGHRKPEITIGYIIARDNYAQLYPIVNRLKRMGVDRLRFKREITSSAPFPTRMIERLIADFVDEDFHISVTNPVDSPTSELIRKCFLQGLWGTVGPDGSLYPCDHATYTGAPSFGNLLEEGFQDIWEGPRRKAICATLPRRGMCKVCSPFSTHVNELFALISNAGKR